MHLSEWLGESFDPGAVGEVEVRAPERGRRTRRGVLVRAVVASVFVACVAVLALAYTGWPRLALLLGLPAYMVLAYFVHPSADTSTVGGFGGLMDDPLRWSDDANRALVILGFLLPPGRFVAQALVAGAALLVHVSRATDSEGASGPRLTEPRSDERRP